jgi:hypothetical protein
VFLRGRLQRHCGELRRQARRWRRVARLAGEFLRGGAAFRDDLIEAAIESRQRLGDAIRSARIGRRRGNRRRSMW